MDWLEEELGGYDDDYLVFDCPGEHVVCRRQGNKPMASFEGQIELYTHHPFLPTLVQHLTRLNIRVCAAYLIESQFMEDRYKFFRFVLLEFRPASQLISLALVGYCQQCPPWSTLKYLGSTSCQKWIW